jgi:fucose permease
MLSVVLSTIAFFLASYVVGRYLDEIGIAKGMTRGALIFSIALAIAYLVALAVDFLA